MGDLDQPVLRLLDLLPALERPIGVHEGRLRDVLGVGRIPQQCERVVVDVLDVTPIEVLERPIPRYGGNLRGSCCHDVQTTAGPSGRLRVDFGGLGEVSGGWAWGGGGGGFGFGGGVPRPGGPGEVSFLPLGGAGGGAPPPPPPPPPPP